MSLRLVIGCVSFIALLAVTMYIFKNSIVGEILSAQDQVQAMHEIKINPNTTTAIKACIPKSYGKLTGVESVGKASMLWFEAPDGTIRRVQVSFWEDEIILDDKTLVIERN